MKRAAGLDLPPWLGAAAPAGAVLVLQLAVFPVSAGVWLQGLVIGLLNALVVLGMMLVYRANRVLNLAQASIGTLPAGLGVGLFLFGAPSLIVSGWLGLVAGLVGGVAAAVLGRVERGRSVATGAAVGVGFAALVSLLGSAGYFGGLIVGLLAAALIGLAVDLIVVRRFRRSPRLVLTVATIGLAQFFAVGSLLVARLWGRQQLVERNVTFEFPGSFEFTVATTVFHGDEVFALIVAVACLVGVSVALARTDMGMAVRAAAERHDRAAMLGVPVERLEAVVWVVASVLAFLGSYLQAGILGLEISAGVGLRIMVAALAAMALAGFGSLPTAVMAAVAIGVLNVAAGPGGAHALTTADTVMALVVVLALLARRSARRRADRADTSSWQASVDPPAVPAVLADLAMLRYGRWALVTVGLVAAFALPSVLSPSQDFRAAMVTALAVLALSVVVLTGWTGEVTLGQMAVAAVGAAVTAYVTVEWQFDLLLALPLAGLAAAAVAVLLGVPSLRWQGVFLAVTTLAFGVAAVGWILNPNQATWIPRGPVSRRPLLGVFELSDDAAMYRVSLVVLVLCLVMVAGVRRSRPGRVLRAVRDNAPGAQAFGVRVPLARLMAFGLSGFLAGVSGGLIVYVSEAYDIATYGADQGINVFISAVVGGVGSSLGAVLGAVVLDGSRNFASGPWSLLPTSLGVLVVLMFLPGGLAELAFRARLRVFEALARSRGISLVRSDRSGLDGREDPAPDTTVAEAPSTTVDAVSVASVDRGPGAERQLRIRGLDVAYDKVQVLFGVDLDVRPGEITAILGTNGAGKSTLLRAIGGVAPISAGSVHLGDVDLRSLAPDEIAGVGIAQMPGGSGVFGSLTVDENLRVAAWGIRGDASRLAAKRVELHQMFPVLEQRCDEQAGDLSGGQQQQLALAMAMITDPEILLVDELSLGLAPLVAEQLLVRLRELRDDGTTIVIVEQSVNLALSVADHAYFMEKGAIRFSGSAEELTAQPDLVRAIYLQGTREALAASSTSVAKPAVSASEGGSARDQPDDVNHTASQSTEQGPVLEVDQVRVTFGGIAAVSNVSLTVARGEIVGLIGPNGAGKTTLFDLISGFTRADSGEVRLMGNSIETLPPSARARRGLGRSFQDARLFPALTVAETIATSLERWVEAGDPLTAALRLPAGQLTEAAVASRVAELLEVFNLVHLRRTPIAELSTGTRRMVDLACVVAHGPSVVLLDEPTSGIAQREAEALGPVLVDLRRNLDASMIIIEHDISLICAVSDRLVALDSGAVVTAGVPAEVLNHRAVVASYLGTSPEALNRSDQTISD